MKKTLILALSAALLTSTAAMAQDGSAEVQTTKTTTTTVQHIGGNHETWYREGGVVPTQYRTKTYVVESWQDQHLNEPPSGSHWVRGDNGDFLLVNEDTGAITSIVHQH